MNNLHKIAGARITCWVCGKVVSFITMPKSIEHVSNQVHVWYWNEKST